MWYQMSKLDLVLIDENQNGYQYIGGKKFPLQYTAAPKEVIKLRKQAEQRRKIEQKQLLFQLENPDVSVVPETEAGIGEFMVKRKLTELVQVKEDNIENIRKKVAP